MGKNYLVGYVGVIGKQEGLNYLIDAVSHIVKERKRQDIHFTCIGSGTELPSMIHYSSQMEVSDYITFTGRIPDDQLLKILNTSDVCVNPDEYNEMNDKSTMNKILEYMALGKPIVQFDLMEGRFSAREASLYAQRNNSKDFGDKILFLIDHPEERKKMGESGYTRIMKELQWDIEKLNLFKAYRHVFQSK